MYWAISSAIIWQLIRTFLQVLIPAVALVVTESQLHNFLMLDILSRNIVFTIAYIEG